MPLNKENKLLSFYRDDFGIESPKRFNVALRSTPIVLLQDTEKIWNNFLTVVFLSDKSNSWRKKARQICIFMISAIIQALFKIKIHHRISEQEMKWQRIYDLLYAETKEFSLFTAYNEKKIYRKRGF